MLALAQSSDQHNLPAGEFQCIVMRTQLIHVDLPKAGHVRSELPAREKAESSLALGFLVERKLRARTKTDSDVWLSRSRKNPSDGV